MDREQMIMSMAEEIYMAAPRTTVNVDPLDGMPLYDVVPFAFLSDHETLIYKHRALWAIQKMRDWLEEGVDVQSF